MITGSYATMKMRDVEHAAGLFTNGLAAAFYAVRLSGYPAFPYFRSNLKEKKSLSVADLRQVHNGQMNKNALDKSVLICYPLACQVFSD